MFARFLIVLWGVGAIGLSAAVVSWGRGNLGSVDWLSAAFALVVGVLATWQGVSVSNEKARQFMKQNRPLRWGLAAAFVGSIAYLAAILAPSSVPHWLWWPAAIVALVLLYGGLP